MKQDLETKNLYAKIAELLQTARNAVVRAVNQTMVYTYYEIGRIIVEDEQQGEERAEYGKQVLKELSAKLTKEFGRGFSVDNLQNMRQFYLVYGKYEKPFSISVGDETIITVDIGCEKGDEFWEMDEETISELCLKHLAKIVPDVRERFLGSSVIRTPIAYPVFLNEYEAERQKFEKSTNVENLLSVGRNGEFSHIFMEDVYWRTRKKVQQLLEQS